MHLSGHELPCPDKEMSVHVTYHHVLVQRAVHTLPDLPLIMQPTGSPIRAKKPCTPSAHDGQPPNGVTRSHAHDACRNASAD